MSAVDNDGLPKPIGDDPYHQEGVVPIYFDKKAGIGGFHRIGHAPHWQDGQGKMISWAGVAAAYGQRFARNLQQPFRVSFQSWPAVSLASPHILPLFEGRDVANPY